jgi:hypothetical protein
MAKTKRDPAADKAALALALRGEWVKRARGALTRVLDEVEKRAESMETMDLIASFKVLSECVNDRDAILPDDDGDAGQPAN